MWVRWRGGFYFVQTPSYPSTVGFAVGELRWMKKLRHNLVRKIDNF